MDETLDWMDEFDDSVFDDTIEANDTSALTGFENNTETSNETSSPLEATETETTNTSEDVTQSSDDFFTNFTPTVNFSMARAAGPSSMNNDAHSKGDKPTGGTNNDDDDKDIDLDDYYGGGKTDGDDDDDDDYGSWTDKDRSEAAKEAADAAEKESATASAEAELADKEYKDLQSQVDDKLSEFNAAADKKKDAVNEYNSVSNGDFANIDVDDLREGKTVTLKDGNEVTYYEYTGTNAAQKAATDARNEAIDRLVEATADYENTRGTIGGNDVSYTTWTGTVGIRNIFNLSSKYGIRTTLSYNYNTPSKGIFKEGHHKHLLNVSFCKEFKFGGIISIDAVNLLNYKPAYYFNSELMAAD